MIAGDVNFTLVSNTAGTLTVNATLPAGAEYFYAYLTGPTTATKSSAPFYPTNTSPNTLTFTGLSAGQYTVQCRGASGSGGTADYTALSTEASLEVAGLVAPSISMAIRTVVVNTSFTASASNSGGTPSSWVCNSALPAGVSFSNGTFSGTPTVTGSYSMSFTATNAAGSSTTFFDLNVISAVPVITSSATANGVTGSWFTYQITATNSPTSYSFSVTPSVTWSISPTTGLIQGDAPSAGTYTMVVTASKGASNGSQNVTVTIKAPLVVTSGSGSGNYNASEVVSVVANTAPAGQVFDKWTGNTSQLADVNSASTTFTTTTTASTITATYKWLTPVVTSSGTVAGQVGTALLYTVTGSNTPTSYSASNLPPGLAINTGSGVISGTPTTAGSYSATVNATNPGGTGSATVVFTIAPLVPSIVSALTASTTVGATFSYTIVALNNPASFNATNLPPGLSVDTGSGVISGVATGVGGVYDVTISATNVSGTNSKTLVISVLGPPVVSSPASGTFAVGSAANTYTITASNTPTSFGVTELPSGLSISGNHISGTPTTAALTLWRLGRTTTVSATNAAGTGTKDVTFTVNPAIPSPIVTTPITLYRGVATTQQISVASDLYITSYGATDLPPGLSVNTSTGAITGTPTTLGTTTASFSATNVSGIGFNGQVFIVVRPAPTISNGTLTLSGLVGAQASYQITSSEATSYSSSALPGGLTLNTSTGLISGTPTTTGVFSVSITATNETSSDTKTLTITIKDIPHITSSLIASCNRGSAFSYSIVATNVTSPHSSVSYDAAGLPAGLSVDTSTGVISGTPTVAGVSSVTIVAVNDVGAEQQVLVLTIVPPAPTITNTNLAVSLYRGQQLNYLVEATESPASYMATNVPPGILLTGPILGGSTTSIGVFNIGITATNTGGTSAVKTLVLTVSELTAPTTNPVGGTASAPVFSGTAAPNTWVNVYDNGVLVDSVLTNGAGVWTYSPTPTPGSHSFTFAQVVNGFVGTSSSPQVVVVPTPPSLPVPPSAPSVPTITGSGTTTPVISGTNTPGTVITVYDGNTPIKTIVVAGNGTWSIPLADLSAGSHSLSLTATSTDGLVSPRSSTFSVVVAADTTPPSTGVLPDRTGTASNPTFSGTTEPGATVRVYDNGVLIGTTVADNNGNWSITLNLAPGSHQITFTYTDTKGNASAPFGPAAPIVVTTPAPTNLPIAYPPDPKDIPGQFGIIEPFELVGGIPSDPNDQPMTLYMIGEDSRFWGAQYNLNMRTLATRLYSLEQIVGTTGIAKTAATPEVAASYEGDLTTGATPSAFTYKGTVAHPSTPLSGDNLATQVSKTISYLGYLSKYTRDSVAALNNLLGPDQVPTSLILKADLTTAMLNCVTTQTNQEVNPRIIKWKVSASYPNPTESWGTNYLVPSTYEGSFVSNNGHLYELWTSSKLVAGVTYNSVALYDTMVKSVTHASKYTGATADVFVLVGQRGSALQVPVSVVTTLRSLKCS